MLGEVQPAHHLGLVVHHQHLLERSMGSPLHLVLQEGRIVNDVRHIRRRQTREVEQRHPLGRRSVPHQPVSLVPHLAQRLPEVVDPRAAPAGVSRVGVELVESVGSLLLDGLQHRLRSVVSADDEEERVSVYAADVHVVQVQAVLLAHATHGKHGEERHVLVVDRVPAQSNSETREGGQKGARRESEGDRVQMCRADIWFCCTMWHWLVWMYSTLSSCITCTHAYIKPWQSSTCANTLRPLNAAEATAGVE